MILMTLSITVAFLVRSSSLIGWIPLALLKMCTSFDYSLNIIYAGILVALPTVAFSCITDIISYGKITIP
jgi:hypothetical protein